MGTTGTNRPLTPKQLAFVREYLIDFNGTQACIRAGYSAKTAFVKANQLINNSLVQAAIQKARAKRELISETNEQWVLDQLKKNYERAMEVKFTYDKEGTELSCSYEGNVANRALELIGKHRGMFVEQHKITAVVDVTTHELTDDERVARLVELTER